MTEILQVSMVKQAREKCSKMMKANTSTITIPEVEFAYGWNRFHLRMIGLWPEQTCEKSEANLLTKYSGPMFGMFVMIVLVLPQALALLFYSFELDDFVQLCASIIGIVGAVMKSVVLWNNGELLALCLCSLIEDWKQRRSTKEREVMIKKAELGRKISIGFGVLMHCLVWSYVVLKILPLFSLRVNMDNGTEIWKYMLYPGFYPLDIGKPSNFLFIWVAQLLGTVCSTIAYTATDCFVAMLVIHLCGQIAVLRRALNNCLDDNASLDTEVFHENLAVIVERHVTLVKTATLIEQAVNLMLLVLVLIYTVILGLQLYGLMMAVTMRKPGHFPFIEVLFFASYVNITIIHLYLYCYVGDMLIEESEALGFASYSCKWYDLSGSKARDLMIVMHRARLPLQLSARKFVAFSLELFGNVIKTSISYFSVLLTMKEQMPA